MKRLRFKADEVVELVMPCSEAMLHAKLAGARVRLMVTEHVYKERTWPRLHFIEPQDVPWGPVLGEPGYTLAECGIQIVDEGYEGIAPSPDDASPEEVQRGAWALTAKLAESLG